MRKHRIEIITELKKKFFSSAPETFSEASNSTLKEWYCEFILMDKNAKLEIY